MPGENAVSGELAGRKLVDAITVAEADVPAAYGSRNICFRNSDGIYKLSAGELSRYSVFAGHLNYDSLLYVPRRILSVQIGRASCRESAVGLDDEVE